MGSVNAITASTFSAQGHQLHATVRVCFHYLTGAIVGGVIVRDDIEEPFETIIKLDDGRYVRATECQYSRDPGWNLALAQSLPIR